MASFNCVQLNRTDLDKGDRLLPGPSTAFLKPIIVFMAIWGSRDSEVVRPIVYNDNEFNQVSLSFRPSTILRM